MGPATAPCSTRSTTRDARLGARPQASDSSENSRVAPMNRRTSPTRRAIQPESGSAMARLTVNEVITQVPWLGLMARSPAMVGMATLAMEVSRMFMNTASDTPNVSSTSCRPVIGALLPVMAHHGELEVAGRAVAADDRSDQLLGAGQTLCIDRGGISGLHQRVA